MSPGEPAAQYMDETGLTGSTFDVSTPETSDRLVGGKTVAGFGTVSDRELPSPFVSTSLPAAPDSQIVAPTGEVFGFNLGPISSVVAFFQPSQKVDYFKTGETTLPTEKRLIREETVAIPGGNQTTQYYETTGGKKIEYAGVGTPIAGSSGYDKFNQNIRDAMRLPPVEVGEQALSFAAWTNPMTLPFKIEEKITGKPSYGASVLGVEGQYKAFYEQPAAFALNMGIGAAFGIGAKGIEAAYIGSKAVTAERAISQGGPIYRGAEMAGSFVMGRAPQALALVYGADVAYRATSGGTNLDPVSATQRGKGIAIYEAGAMAFGFEAPGAAVKAARLSDQGYKQALLENPKTGRFDYYVKEPTVQATRPYTMDYKAQAMDVKAATGKDLGVGEYVVGKVQRAGYDVVSGAKAIPETVAGKAYQIKSTAAEAWNHPAAYAQEYARPAVSPENEFAFVYEKSVKAPAREIPTPKDVMLSAYSKYYDIRAGAIKSYNQPVASEIIRAPTAPENEFAFVYGKPEKMPLLTRISGVSLSRVVPLSSFGETKPLYGAIATVGGRTSGDRVSSEKLPEGGFPATSKFRTTTFGGKTRTGLAKEPSLQSMGMKESITKGAPPKRTGNAVDYRGKPASKTMKPMTRESLGYQGKQAAGGNAILSERLPVAEGMNQGKVLPQQQRFAGAPSAIAYESITGGVRVTEPSLAFSQGVSARANQQPQQRGVVRVVQPELAFSPDSAIRQDQNRMFVQDIVTVPTAAIRSAQVQVQPQIQSREVVQSQRRSLFVGSAERMASGQMATPESSYRVTPTPSSRVGQDVFSVPSFKFDQGIKQGTQQDQRTDQITRGGQWQRGWETPPPPPPPPIKTPGGGLPWGGAGGESPFTRKRRSAFIETFNMGLDMGFLGRKGRAAKSFTTPAKYKRKPAAAKPSPKKSTSRRRK
jgi:hypothetical protein